MTKNNHHRWQFVRVGGVDQIVIRSGADITHIPELDQKLWVALASPAKLLEFDTRTLELLDLSKDGRIRAPDIVAVSRWVEEVFKNPDDLLAGGDVIRLNAINTGTAAGADVRATAERFLREIGKPEGDSISLGEISGVAALFAGKAYNGDGVLPPEGVEDPAVRRVVEELLSTHGGVPDRNGKAGVNLDQVKAFFSDIDAFLNWQGSADVAILPLGARTAAAAEAVKCIRAKVDDYFARCRLAEFDNRAAAALNEAEAEFKAMCNKELSLNCAEILKLPLAAAAPGRPLSLETGTNPGWQAAIEALRSHALSPEKRELTLGDWTALQARLAPFSAWMARKPATAVEKLGVPRMRELITSGARDRIVEQIQKDLAESHTYDRLVTLEKVVRVQRDLFRFLNNFVSFSDFYQRKGAIFQAGTLYLDARSCDLCVHVADPAKHAALAGLARTYLAYCDCTRAGEKMTIAAAFTAGDSDHLMVGRNGVFYDRQGRDWDATITKIIDNPISLRQAFWSPYKKFVRMIEEQVAQRAAAADKANEAKMGTTATHIVALDPGKVAPVPGKPEPKKLDVGTVAALGVALGSIGTFFGVIFAKFIDLGWWLPVALLGVIAAISGPSILIAWLKLRQRNLGPILDANGWAVNGRMKINVPFGGALSRRAKIPPGSEVRHTDPFEESHRTRNTLIAITMLAAVLIVLWRFSLLNAFLPPQLQRPIPTSTNAPTAGGAHSL